MDRSLAAPDWLVARPIAHRGLHDRASDRLENSLSAARAAIEAGFAIECDVQRSQDGEAVVFHDVTLDRLTDTQGRVAERSMAALNALTLGPSGDRIIGLPALLATIDGRVPLICEIKSGFDGDLRLADRVAALACGYGAALAVKSFDPQVIVHLRTRKDVAERALPLGIVAEARYDDPEWAHLDRTRKQGLAALTHITETQPDFLSYHVADLPHAATTLFRAWRRPVLAWTVRTEEQRHQAALWADQIVFEGFRA